ncbi:c-type cytochrome [Dankookia rubra]|nr:cytochrome c [Dankookia rubra]
MPGPSLARRAAGPGAALAALGCGAGLVVAGLGLTRSAPALDAAAVARGAATYAAHCTECHGVPGGPAPPLDAGGHAWRHADEELAGIIALGIGGPGRQGVAMPGFAGQLGPDGIADLVAYLKSTWPAELRRRQAALGPGGAADLRALLADPSATLPGTCLAAPP